MGEVVGGGGCMGDVTYLYEECFLLLLLLFVGGGRDERFREIFGKKNNMFVAYNQFIQFSMGCHKMKHK